jgi:hypothetical protein
LQFMVDLGSNILQKCFGVKPVFFVFPYNTWSWEAIQVLQQKYKGVNVSKINCSRRFSIKFNILNMWKNQRLRNYFFYDDFLMVEHSLSLDHFGSNRKLLLDKVKNAIETNRITILVNHYWQYFFDWCLEGNKEFFGCWQQITDYLFSQKNLCFLTFSQLYNLLTVKKEGF